MSSPSENKAVALRVSEFGQRTRGLYHDALRLYADICRVKDGVSPALPIGFLENLETVVSRSHRALECISLYLAKNTGEELTE